MKNSKEKYILYAFIFLILVLASFFVARYILVIYGTSIPKDFSYSAELISMDNFYDEESDRFLGDKQSVSTFYFNNVGSEGNIRLIKNVFEVSSLDGERIFSAERLYAINSIQWAHAPGFGDAEREGFLFGPHIFASKEHFQYWHINYNTPIEMRFLKEEVVEGLNVYVYTGEFTVDQTQDLSVLPGVPEEKGLNLDGTIKLLIEPVSGWLVGYEDNSIAYYYDQQTNERLHPWNKFSNRYTKKSIEQQASFAKNLKVKIYGMTYGLPVLIFVFGVLLLGTRRIIPRKYAFLLSVVVLCAFGIFLFLISINTESNKKIIIGISRWVPLGNISYDENIQGFKDALMQAGYEEGKDVEYILEVADGQPEKQKETAQNFLKQNVDLIFSQTTPGTAILKDSIHNQPIVFSIVTYPVEAGLIASNQSSGNNLVGTRNWISAYIQLENFLVLAPDIQSIGFVHRTGEANSTIQLGEMQKVAEQYDISIVEIHGKDLGELKNALNSIENPPESIFSACDTLVQGEAEKIIIEYVQKHSIPSFSCNITGPAKGDLIGTVADFYTIGKLAGEKAALILQGLSPEALTIDTVLIPDIYINKRTADDLGIQIPQNLTARTRKIYE